MKNNLASKMELKVMSVIWKKWENDNEGSNLHYITDEVNKEREVPLKIQTTATFLDRLEGKGYLTRTKKIGRYSYWKPLISKEEWAEYAAKELCKILDIPADTVVAEIMRLQH